MARAGVYPVGGGASPGRAPDTEQDDRIDGTTTGSFLATGRGKVTLPPLRAVTFLDVADGSIVKVALPSIRTHLDQ